jgi:hypothetical protein
MTNDRNYLRMMHDVELTRYARDNFTTDLELVLLERLWTLMDVEEHLEDAKKEIVELTKSRDHWRMGAIHAEDELDALRCAE